MTVELSRRGEAALITLNRPEALNALSFDILRQLGEVFDTAAGTDARVLMITGAGERAFCAGADIKELKGRGVVAEKRGTQLGQAVFAKLDGLAIPSIALINGYAFGGGLELALAATFRLASPNAKLGLPEVKLGLIPGYGGTQRLPRLIGEARAMDMILTGRTVGAEEAERIGLVHRVVEDADLIAAGLDYAGQFTGSSRPVLEMAREAVKRAYDTPINEGLKIEADLSTLAYRTEDAVEGMSAFEEKRKPDFKDA
jgi:enoyl-CoA hydratase